MNKHILYDKLIVQIGSATIGRDRFFSQNIESESYAEHLNHISLEIPGIEEGFHEVEAQTLVGTLDPAYYVMQWNGKGYPTIIYHHGNNERPFDFRKFAKNSFKKIFVDVKKPIEANIIAVRAPFHKESFRAYQKKITCLSNFVAMLATSVKLIGQIIDNIKRHSNHSKVLVSGISLGGWVTNLHRSFYNTADAYVPLLAGAALDHLFTNSGYRKMGGQLARENPEKIREILNFEEEFQKADDNVYPLLGRYDQYIQYERQKSCYKNQPVKLLETGHVTSLLAANQLRKHILRVLHIKKKINESMQHVMAGI